jgi:hypothetical protein
LSALQTFADKTIRATANICCGCALEPKLPKLPLDEILEPIILPIIIPKGPSKDHPIAPPMILPQIDILVK